MPKSRSPLISARKRPRQARSAQLVADILEAAVRVLARDGGARFNTVRVAEEAGVSVGSLYQYFPNKEALLFRLQAEEWDDTWSILESILSDVAIEPRGRLQRAVVTFFRSEREEAGLRAALDDAEARFRDTPEARKLWNKALASLCSFVEEAVPGIGGAERDFAAELLMTTMSAVAEKITRERRSRPEVDAWAIASAEMYYAYLERLRRPRSLEASPPRKDRRRGRAHPD